MKTLSAWVLALLVALAFSNPDPVLASDDWDDDEEVFDDDDDGPGALPPGVTDVYVTIVDPGMSEQINPAGMACRIVANNHLRDPIMVPHRTAGEWDHPGRSFIEAASAVSGGLRHVAVLACPPPPPVINGVRLLMQDCRISTRNSGVSCTGYGRSRWRGETPQINFRAPRQEVSSTPRPTCLSDRSLRVARAMCNCSTYREGNRGTGRVTDPCRSVGYSGPLPDIVRYSRRITQKRNPFNVTRHDYSCIYECVR